MLLTFTIMTTESSDFIRSLHNRMPVILDPKNIPLWLHRSVQDVDAVQRLLKPYEGELDAWPVSTRATVRRTTTNN